MNVMKKAWEIAKDGVAKFGGKVKEYFAEALRIAWSIAKGENKVEVKSEVRFPYCKKHWAAKITGNSVQYKLQREFLDSEEDGLDIVYGDLENGYYQLSRFGKRGEYMKIENGVITDVEESEVMEFFNAPERGMAPEREERNPIYSFGIGGAIRLAEFESEMNIDGEEF